MEIDKYIGMSLLLKDEKCRMTATNTALVIDDHPLVARGIAEFMGSLCGFSYVHSVSNTDDFWRYMRHADFPSLVVVDFWLADGTALSLVSLMRERHPHIPLLIISADDDAAIQEKVQSAGASGFFHKREAPEVFANAVAAILNGKVWFRSEEQCVSNKPAHKEMPMIAEEFGLTTRQGEVLLMVLQGFPNKRIAQALLLSEQTVKEHISAILGKFGVRNRIEIITKLRERRIE